MDNGEWIMADTSGNLYTSALCMIRAILVIRVIRVIRDSNS